MGRRRTLIILAALLVACNSKPDYTLSKEDIKFMKQRYIFNQNGKKAYMPLVYGLKNYVFKIFSVPGKNRVGTIELDNGFTLIEFKDDELEYDLIAKDYYEEVYGAFTYSFAPVYSDEEILYSQNSWLFNINVNNGEVSEYQLLGGIIKNLGVFIHRLAATKNDGIVGEIQLGDTKVLKLLNIKEKPIEKGELAAGVNTSSYDQPWQFSNGNVFTYDSAANEMLCHTIELKQTNHPFTEIFNRNSGKFRKLKEFLIHPTLPFGIVVEIGKDIDWSKVDSLPISETRTLLADTLDAQSRIHALYLIRWDTQDTNKQFVPIFTEPISVIPDLHPKTYSDFQWSPDGKWLVFRDETQHSEWQEGTPTSEQSPVFIAMPISENNPIYFGEPLYLGKVMRENATPESSAWIQKPVSFVVSDGLALYKWELDTLKSAMTINTPNDVVKTR